MINSKDLFEQIGFVIDSPPQNFLHKSKRQTEYKEKPFQSNQVFRYKTIEQDFQKPEYVTSLQIELGEDQNHLLTIRSYDDPYELAINFCKKHNLNQLAVEIIENKIFQAKKKQEDKFKQKIQETERKNTESYRSKNPKQMVPFANGNQQFINNKPYQRKLEQMQNKTNEIVSRLITASKQPQKKQSLSRSKGKSARQGKDRNKSAQKVTHKKFNSTLDKACQNLYLRGILQTKALEEKRIKRQQQIEKKEEQELTFKPKINQVSEKIIEFRKETGTVPIPNPKKMKKQMPHELYQQLVECTFTPEINPISKIIVHNREAYRNEDEHFNKMFNNTENSDGLVGPLHQHQLNHNRSEIRYENKKSKNYLLKQKQMEQKELFKPRLNPKSVQRVKEPFNVRLSRAIEVKQKIRDGQYMNDQYTFKPEVGRAPYYQPSRGQQLTENKENLPVWQQLYKESKIRAAKNKDKTDDSKNQKKLTHASNSFCEFDSMQRDESGNSQFINAKVSSNLHYENLIQKKINSVFELLDSDEDGIISPNTIGIENLTKNTLIFLKPIFQEMDQLNAELNYNQFKKAVINLLNDSDPYKKGLFLSDNHKKQCDEPTFAPKINKKSRQLAEGRSNSQIHLELYEQGLKNQKKKQFMLEKERAKKQEKELEECSFKPCLHLGRKDYHPSILDKKLSEINFSINQSSNSNKDISSYPQFEDIQAENKDQQSKNKVKDLYWR